MSPQIAYLTSGAAGMFCGSCMHDNTLAKALTRQGVDIQLIPTYTPIRTDETDVSVDRVFFGGINVFLQQKFSLFRYVPRVLDRFLDNRRILRWATSRGIEISAHELGSLTVSMLKGRSGYQRKEVKRLCDWLSKSLKPDLIVLSNMLIAGCLPSLKESLDCPLLVTLQGDDIFLQDLIEPYQSQAMTELRRLIDSVDGFLVNSHYYAQHMRQLLDLPHDRIHQVPLGIELAGFPKPGGATKAGDATSPRPLAIGYLARLAKEKGLHQLVDAYLLLKRSDEFRDLQLKVAGWMGEDHRQYAEQQFQRVRDAGFGDDFSYHGSVTRAEKIDFLQQLDVLSVPTTYHEPKGLFVLEALAAGVPVVQPAHGAFPELLEATGGGWLTAPDDIHQLADSLRHALTHPEQRRAFAHSGQTTVHERFNDDAMARATLEVYRQFLPAT